MRSVSRALFSYTNSQTFVPETLYRPLVPPPVKVLGYAAIADLFKYLPLSKANPQAVDVRQKLQLASWMSLWPLKLPRYRSVETSFHSE